VFAVQPSLLIGGDTFGGFNTYWGQPTGGPSPQPYTQPFVPMPPITPQVTNTPSTSTQTPSGTVISPIVPRALPSNTARDIQQPPAPKSTEDNTALLLVVLVLGVVAWRFLK
jgi:hypothetical protein